MQPGLHAILQSYALNPVAPQAVEGVARGGNSGEARSSKLCEAGAGSSKPFSPVLDDATAAQIAAIQAHQKATKDVSVGEY